MLKLAEQIREALSMFARNGTEPALIGGLAVVAHQVVRALFKQPELLNELLG